MRSGRQAWAAGLVVAWWVAICAGQDGWTPLFNGRDLDGWKRLGGEGRYHVEDGAIVGTYVAGTTNTFLATEREFGDFVLEFEFKVDEGVNSGVQFRSLSTPEVQDGRVHGFQFEIDPSPRAYSAGVYDESRRGWLYPVSLNPPAREVFKPGEWNAARIECVGTSLRTWLNGRPVAHVIDDATARGFIALQVHGLPEGSADAGKTVRWRGLRIRTDVAAPTPAYEGAFIRNLIPNELSGAERAQGWRLLFDGRTTAGWRGAHKERFPEAGWEIRDGALMVQASGGAEAAHGGDIVTEDEFSAFEFHFEFKLTPGANSGVKYFVTEGYLTAGQQASAIGLEYQLLDDERNPDAQAGVVGNRTLASLYDLIPSYRRVYGQEVPRRVGDWNHGRIVVTPANQVEHWLNGYQVLAYERGSNIYAALVARSKYKDWENFGLAERGHLLLQDHGDEVHFRSLKIRELGGAPDGGSR